MSSTDSDLCPRPSVRRRPSLDALCQLGGPPVLAAILKEPGARWSREFAAARDPDSAVLNVDTDVPSRAGRGDGDSSAHPRARALRLPAAQLPADGPAASVAELLGFVVFQGWRWVRERTSTYDARVLIEIMQSFRDRADHGFLEHEVLASCVLPQPVKVCSVRGDGWMRQPDGRTGAQLSAHCADAGTVVHVSRAGELSHQLWSLLLPEWRCC